MTLIICILVATDWLDWVHFKDYFYTVLLYPNFDDSNLLLDDATEPFLPEALWTSFLRDQYIYIYTPILIHEDSHENIYSAKFRLPILESTLLDEEGVQGKGYKVHVDGRLVTYGGGRININVQLMATMKRIAAKKQRDFRAETKALMHFTRCLLQSRNSMNSITSLSLEPDFVILSPWAEEAAAATKLTDSPFTFLFTSFTSFFISSRHIIVARSCLTNVWTIRDARSRQASTDLQLTAQFKKRLDRICNSLDALDVRVTNVETRLEPLNSIRNNVALIPDIVDTLEAFERRMGE
ncbi:hypothetical protein LTR46_008253 [Exophiala xenobiotica]|nr:hypothetical protein LTR18_003252 [Exophiala xenobiotica]KAK5553707.1 hypothetical protein LTR46_008253 [Exophiala xenobiotica]